MDSDVNIPEETKTQKGMMNTVKVFVAIIIIAAVGYSDLMFLGIVQGMFPEGLLRLGAIVGAVTTALSILALLAGKVGWFTPGGQTITAWIFTGVEVIVLIMNDILAFALHNGGATMDPNLHIWYQFCPSSPVISVIGWVIVICLDESLKERHAYAEMQAKINEEQRKLALEVASSQIEVRRHHLKYVKAFMKQELSSEAVQEEMQFHAQLAVGAALRDATGIEPSYRAQQQRKRGPSTDPLAQKGPVIVRKEQ